MISMQEMPEKAPAGNHKKYFLSLELLEQMSLIVLFFLSL
jgi:hypothetical protein